MREKLQTLPLTELKELAKAQGIRGISGMKKSDLTRRNQLPSVRSQPTRPGRALVQTSPPSPRIPVRASPRTRRQTQLRALAQTSPRIREAGARGLISQRPRQTALRICRS